MKLWERKNASHFYVFSYRAPSVDLRPHGVSPTAAARQQQPLKAIVLDRELPNSGTAYELHVVPTQDEGDGPFPAILFGSGAGRGGVPVIENAPYRLEPMMDDMISRGYVVVYTNPRNEMARAYNYLDRPETLPEGTNHTERTPRLDSDDYVTFIQYMGELSYVSGVGTVGASHNGELQSKAASEITWGAAVSIEGASHEYLAVDYDKVTHEDDEMQIRTTEVATDVIDEERARARTARIETPFLHMGRTQDSLNGLFLLAHELMVETGKDSTWYLVDHPVHGYGLLYRRPGGSYQPDGIQVETYNTWMAFLDKHLKGRETAAR